MTRSDHRPDPEFAALAGAVDAILGESSAEAHAARRQLEIDPAQALATAGVRDLFEQLRGLTVEPSGRVPVAVRYAAARRARLRARRPGAGAVLRSMTARTWLGVPAVAAVVLAALVLWQRPGALVTPSVSAVDAAVVDVAAEADEESAGFATVGRRTLVGAAPVEPDDAAVEDVLAVGGLGLRATYEALARLERDAPHQDVLRADNDLALLRYEFRQRFTAAQRRRLMRANGGDPGLEGRVQALAAAIAARLEREPLHAVGPRAAALALRALLAAGSSPSTGHRGAVAALRADLARRLPEVRGADRVAVLAAMVDVAVLTDGVEVELVRRYATALARSVSRPAEVRVAAHGHGVVVAQRRPELLRIETPAASLADAGHVLRLAPAFGVDPALARQARRLVAAHLQERLAAASVEQPALLAAQLYGFGDLVDRGEVDRMLSLWRPRLMASADVVALYQMAWGQYPPRPGWARFQWELREVGAAKTPESVLDTAALLLSVATNFAAPGVAGVLELDRVAGQPPARLSWL